jgi:hypothetical protein
MGGATRHTMSHLVLSSRHAGITGTADLGAVALVSTTAARIWSIVSSDAQDGVAGTGLLTVRVEGSNATEALVSEVVTLNGTTPVLTTGSYRWIRIIGLTAGSGLVAAGTITATAATDTSAKVTVVLGQVRSFDSLYVLPPSSRLRVLSIDAGIADATATMAITVRLLVQAPGATLWVPAYEFVVGVDGSREVHPVGLVVEGGSALKLAATAVVGSTPVVATFIGSLEL